MSEKTETETDVTTTENVKENSSGEDVETETVTDEHQETETTAKAPQISSPTSSNGSFFEQIKQMVNDGADQRVVIETRTGNRLLDISLVLGLVIGGLLALLTPFLAVILVIAGLFTKTSLNIISAKY